MLIFNEKVGINEKPRVESPGATQLECTVKYSGELGIGRDLTLTANPINELHLLQETYRYIERLEAEIAEIRRRRENLAVQVELLVNLYTRTS